MIRTVTAGIGSDLRHALRLLRRDPRAAVTIMLILSLGIGLNAAAFSFLDSTVLRPFPYDDPDRLVDVVRASHQRFSGPFNWAAYDALGNDELIFEAVGGFRDTPMPIRAGDAFESVVGAEVSAGLFEILGVAPALGRTFEPGDQGPGRQPVVIVSQQLWEARLQSDPDILGEVLWVDGLERTIVGVMPPGFRFFEASTVWVPLPVDGASPDDAYRFSVLGRLRDGMSIEQAQAAMPTLGETLDTLVGEPRNELERLRARAGFTVVPLASGLRTQGMVAISTLVQIAAALVLLIVCANLASLMFARGIARRPEVAVRQALGAPRARLVRQILTENALLAAGGAAGGLVVANWAHDLLLSVLPRQAGWAEFRLDPRVLGFVAIATSLTVVAFGTKPALELSRTSLDETLKAQGAGVRGSRTSRRWQSGLAVTQIALSLVFLVGASMTLRSMAAVGRIDPNFDAHAVYEIWPSFPDSIPDEARWDTTRRFAEALEATPGIEAVGWENYVPSAEIIGNDFRARLSGFVETRSGPSELSGRVRLLFVSDDYFAAFGMRLLRGRSFGGVDVPGGPAVAVINERAAEIVWRDADPVGEQLRGPGAAAWINVVGVVSDVVNLSSGSYDRSEFGMQTTPWPVIYLAASQFDARPQPLLYVRPTVDAASLAGLVRAELARLDSRVPVTMIRTVWEGRYEPAQSNYRVFGRLAGAFGVIAFVLSGLGTYSVISYGWARRIREIGIRMACGATPREVRRMVLRQSQKMAAVGIAVGTLLSLALYRLASGFFFGVSGWDPISYAAVGFLLMTLAGLAALGPARRATATDPVAALRRN